MAYPVSPLAPDIYASLPPIDGVRLATAACGIKYENRTDLLVMEFAEGTEVAGVFTQSLTASAPVEWCRKALKVGSARAIVVNSGNSNAFTGKLGVETVGQTARETAYYLNCRYEEVFVASTGVIGQPFPASLITNHLDATIKKLDHDGWDEAAKAIMTTDTYPKMATRSCQIDGKTVTINGIIKGSGMIAPDMATLLGFVATNAAISSAILQIYLNEATARTLNCITVDSDTSTSDTLILCATGKAGNEIYSNADATELAGFKIALLDLMHELAMLVIKDGEGIQKLVTINVTGAESDKAAHKIGMVIANSPLVKTAIAGEDANWGRIVMAVGKSGERADRDRLQISIGGVLITRNGMAVPNYDETPVNAHMRTRDIVIDVELGIGDGKATVWTCDLTHGYIDINGSYRS